MGLFGLGKIKETPKAVPPTSEPPTPPPPAPETNGDLAVPTPDGAALPIEKEPASLPDEVSQGRAPEVDALIDAAPDPFDPFTSSSDDVVPVRESPAPEEQALQMPDLRLDAPQENEPAAPLPDQRAPVAQQADEPSVPVPVRESPDPVMPPVAEEKEPLVDEEVSAPFADPDPIMNIFVEKAEYQRVLLAVTSMQEVLKSSEEGVAPLLSLDEDASARLHDFRGLLREMQESLMAIDRRLFEEGDMHG